MSRQLTVKRSAVQSSFEYDPVADVCYRRLDFMGLVEYRVGDDGSFWSCKWGKWRQLGLIRKDGYDNGRPLVGGRRLFKTIHQLVLLAFAGPARDGQVTRHMDGIRSHNWICNLRWGTQHQNADDRARHGTTARGEKQGSAKLTAAAVRDIRKRCEAGEAKKLVAVDHGISRRQVSNIVRRIMWQHV